MAKIIDDNGFWLIENNPISKEGVYAYLGRTISKELEPDKLYNVYRPFSELSNSETLKSFDGVPFINGHEMLGDGFTPYDNRTADGVLMNVKAENGILLGDLKIFSEDMKSKIKNGKKELSLGYKCDYEIRQGVFNGISYDVIQTNLRGNHIALVDKGRMGADVRVYDNNYTFDSLDIEIETKPETEEKCNMSEEKDKKCSDEKVDKRELIDKIGGILKDKVDEELWRTVIGIAEKIAYNDSEKSADDETEKETEKAEDAEKEEVKEEVKEEEKEEVKEETEKEAEDTFIDEPKFSKHLEKLIANGKVSSEIGENLKKAIKEFSYTRNLGNDEEKEDETKTAVPEEKKDDEKKTAADSAEITFKEFAKRIAKSNEIASALEPHIGVFDHAEMTPEEVSKYGCEKLGMDFATDEEAMAKISGFITASKKVVNSAFDHAETKSITMSRLEKYKKEHK